MSSELVAWYVSKWSTEPEKHVFSKETPHFYVRASGRREKKETDWYRFYKTEAEAIASIMARQEGEANKRMADRIKAAAPELLEALECLLEMGHTKAGDLARAAIAKARGTPC